jgi:hypothetical protein
MTAWSMESLLLTQTSPALNFLSHLLDCIIISFVHSSSLSKGAKLQLNVHSMLPTRIHLVADVGTDVVVTTVVLAVNLGLGLGT